MLALNVQDIPIILPYSNPHLIRMFQEGKYNAAMIVRKSFAYERRKRVARTATGLEPKHFVILEEYSLPIIIRLTKLHTYRGKTNCSHVLMYASIPSKKQVSMPKSILSQAMNTVKMLVSWGGKKTELLTATMFA